MVHVHPGPRGELAPDEPAPVDPAAVAQALRPFGESRMLPPGAYVDPAVFAWEQRNFFGRGWVCAGLSAEIAEPGSQRAEQAGPGSVLLARAEDGGLRAFANTCRHRGHELLPCGSTASQGVIICPYHSWTYSLSGGLRAAAGFKYRPGFDAAEWGLIELPAGEWHGLVFVDASGGPDCGSGGVGSGGASSAGKLGASLASLAPLIRPYEPERLIIGGRHDYEAAANWKILTENYHECYHCPAIHPELCRVSPPRSGENYAAPGRWVGGWMELRDGMDTMSLDGRSPGVPLRGLSEAARRMVVYVNVFPNILLSLHPDYVMTHRLVPLAADRTRIECTWAFAPESAGAPGFDPAYAVDFWDLTNRQDWRACESVQRGLGSPHARPGPLSAGEDAVYQFVAMVARGYQGKPVWNHGTAAPVDS
jgi:phenylpropionate dioxygenase-like ring-hydroxylating dioxygenase large terminal subunit